MILLDSDSVALTELDERLSGDHTLAPFDLWRSNADLYQKLAEMIDEDYPALDGVVHLAGFCGGLSPVIHKSPEDWLKTLQVNLTAPLWLSRCLLPVMMKAPSARLIFTPFDLDSRQRAYWHGFGVAQVGLQRLIDDLQNENTAYPSVSCVRVHCGWVDTTLTRAVFPDGDKQWRLPEEIVHLYDQALNGNEHDIYL